jgi:DNA (cytosine-5)-methyltransferase 1
MPARGETYNTMTIPFVEMFSGVGGFSAAVQHLPVQVVAAFDQDAAAKAAYERHLGPVKSIDLCGLGSGDPLVLPAEGWWLSPPCQPYTSKGRQLDMDDPRARPLLHLTERLRDYRPSYLLLENVPPFADSRSRQLLMETLTDLKMEVAETLICPTSFGIPNKRNRYYLLASRNEVLRAPPYPQFRRPLAAYLDPPDPSLYLSSELVERLDPNSNIVDAKGVPAVFGSSYGRAIHGAGSYFNDGAGIRRFTPREILRLLHFPEGFDFPPNMRLRSQYKLSGNSVNVSVVRYLVEWLLGS